MKRIEVAMNKENKVIPKVLTGLDTCRSLTNCDRCPYREDPFAGFACIDTLMNDAITLIRSTVSPLESDSDGL